MADIVNNVINRSIRRERGVRLLAASSVTATVLVLALVAVMVADARMTILDAAVRWTMSLGVLALTLLAAALGCLSMRRHRQTERSMAKLLDARHPEFQERLSTMVELSGKPDAGFSRELFDVVCRKAQDDAGSVSVGREFPFKGALRLLYAFLVLAALLLVSIAAAPNYVGRLFVRAVAPWADIGNLYSMDIEVTPGDALVLSGDVLRIEAKLKGSARGTAYIRISRKDTLGWTEEVAEEMRDGVYATTADINEREWRYRVTAGPAVTRFYHVRVTEKPRYRAFSAKVEYPSYTGWSPLSVSNEEVRAISAIDGSRVRFDLEVDDDIVGELVVGGKKNVYKYEMVSNRVSYWSLDLVNRDGIRTTTGRCQLASVLDQPPSIVVEKPKGRLPKLPPYAKIPVELTMSDDVSIEPPRVLASIDGGETRDLGPIDSFVRGGEHLWRGRTEIDLSTLDATEAKRAKFMFVLSDNCPAEFHGPHVVTSSVVEVEIGMSEWGLKVADVKEQTKQARDLAREAKERMQRAKTLAEELQWHLSRTDTVWPELEQKNERLAHELRQAQERLEELMEKLRNDKRLSPMLKELQTNAVENARSALKRMETARFEAKRERENATKESIPEMKKAVDALQKFDKDIENRARELEKMEKMRDLAERQKALAKEMEKIMAERPHDQAKLQAWKQMQEDAKRRATELARQMGQENKKVNEAVEEMQSAVKKAEEARVEAQEAAKKSAENAQKSLENARKSAEATKKSVEEARQAAEKAAQEAAKALEEFKKAAEKAAQEAAEKAEQQSQAQQQQNGQQQQTDQKGEQQANAQAQQEKSKMEDAQARQESAKQAYEAARKAQEKANDAVRRAEEASRRANQEAMRQNAAATEKAEKDAQKAAQDAQEAEREAAQQAQNAQNQEQSQQNSDQQSQQQSGGQQQQDKNQQQQSQQNQQQQSQQQTGGQQQQDKNQQQQSQQQSGGQQQQDKNQQQQSQQNQQQQSQQNQQQQSQQNQQQQSQQNQQQNADQQKKNDQQQQSGGGQQMQDDDENQKKQEQQPSQSRNRQKSQFKSKAGQSASAAAKKLMESVEEQAEKLGMSKDDIEPPLGDDEAPSDANENDATEIGDEFSKLTAEMKRRDDPDFFKKLFSNSGWFKIRGSAKNGLSDRDLENVPLEYRDLTRRYFLKLAEEEKKEKK